MWDSAEQCRTLPLTTSTVIAASAGIHSNNLLIVACSTI
jgi:hypothetical protein